MKLSLDRHLPSSFVIFLSVIILISSISYGINYAEAKDQCAYSPGLRNHFIKLPDGRCMKVDYYVSVECGREAGLCTPRSPSDLSPPPVPTPNPTPIPAPTPPSAPTQTSDNPWPTVGSIIFVLIASYVANKIRKKITRIIRARKYNSSTRTKKRNDSRVGFRNFRNWKNYVRETEQSRRGRKRDDAYLDSLAEEFEDEWESISRSGKAAQLIQMYRDIFDNEFARRQYEHKRPHFWERYEHKKPKEKEGERHEQKRQEREEKPKQESTIDLSKYYKILGLKPGATKEKIKARFRELTLKYHSDRGGSDDKLKEVIEAKEILLKNKKK
tara:strand:- start:49 stop:1032 length:984 start_codon:yes stop_codon:yes gene_type:complete